MIFSKHDWDFQGVASDFQGGDDGSNGDLGCLMDPGTEYCLSALLHPWDGMVGLEVPPLHSFSRDLGHPARLFLEGCCLRHAFSI